ncbi:hypothetical protein MBAV_006217 [Candidatus Magnetobacterium bavaricum]|uniref:Uncharacterized protein n=1 Tax=Candidatus Magnetobacterium bavaricum TaxID=29290 RepID=A0A0F3GI76_9BACT|nr:hypothetical protein MBAV_006217 [Candidatus Magnetobacterium bavaricum]
MEVAPRHCIAHVAPQQYIEQRYVCIQGYPALCHTLAIYFILTQSRGYLKASNPHGCINFWWVTGTHYLLFFPNSHFMLF